MAVQIKDSSNIIVPYVGLEQLSDKAKQNGIVNLSDVGSLPDDLKVEMADALNANAQAQAVQIAYTMRNLGIDQFVFIPEIPEDYKDLGLLGWKDSTAEEIVIALNTTSIHKNNHLWVGDCLWIDFEKDFEDGDIIYYPLDFQYLPLETSILDAVQFQKAFENDDQSIQHFVVLGAILDSVIAQLDAIKVDRDARLKELDGIRERKDVLLKEAGDVRKQFSMEFRK